MSLAQAAGVAEEVFGVSGPVVELGSQQDRNFRIDAPDGRYVLKVANPAFAAAELACQNAAMEHLAGAGLVAPRPRRALVGADLVQVSIGDAELAVRLLGFLDGAPLSRAGYLAPGVRARLGGLAAATCRALADFDHPGLERRLEWDLRHAASVVASYAAGIADGARRERVLSASAQAWTRVERLAGELRSGPIHGDVTDDNVVCRPDPAGRLLPFGVIDFGDTARGWLVAELAIACASLLPHEPHDALAWLPAVGAFDAVLPLEPAEIAALWPLVVLRGATLVAVDEHQLSVDPQNDYVTEGRPKDWRIFEAAASVPCELAEAAIRESLGRGNDGGARVAQRNGFTPLLPGLASQTVRMLDLSATSEALDCGRWLEPGIEAALFAEAARDAEVVVARYGEHRLTRSRVESEAEPATCALLAELQLAAGRPVLAPAAATVLHAGPALLALRSAATTILLTGVRTTLAAGDAVAAGEVVGVVAAGAGERLGRMTVQLCSTPGLDPPAFATPSAASVWRRLCPDPSPLLGVDCAAAPPDAASVLAHRERSFARAQEHYYSSPPQIERGWRQHLVDTAGRAYLDMVNNVTALGHGHPRPALAIARQARLLNTNSRFNYAAVAELCERLAALAPAGLDTVLLVNSGTEATDLALRLAWARTGRRTVIALREAYHGWSLAADAVSSSMAERPAASLARPDWVRLVDSPNAYRGLYRGAESGARYVRDVVEAIDALVEQGRPPAAFISETVYGNAGGVLLPPGYLDGVYAALRARGGISIADEVQVGYGRLGRYFWGFEEQGVVPDVITVAKAMGNGHPLGAVITRRELAEPLAVHGGFFSSTGGSPVSCRAGLAVLDVIEEEGLQENARAVGEHLLERLRELATRRPLVGAVHGLGLYAGVELVRDRETLEPATEEALAICERLRERGVIVQPTGERRNVLKIKPPLCITRRSADFFVDQLEHVLGSGW